MATMVMAIAMAMVTSDPAGRFGFGHDLGCIFCLLFMSVPLGEWVWRLFIYSKNIRTMGKHFANAQCKKLK